MKEKLIDVGSCLLAIALSVAALLAVSELSLCETPSYGETGM